jgi:predicted nucleic acid-binding protein
MQSAVLDSSVYIDALRSGHRGILDLRRLDSGFVVWLSAVVLEELYAGVSAQGRRMVEHLERDFDRINRILVPNLSDWTCTGEVLNELARKHGYEQIGQARLTNDALIAMSARRVGIRVITANERDFRRLAEIRPFQWELTTI